MCSSEKSFSCFLSESLSLSSTGLVTDSVEVVATLPLLALDNCLADELLSVKLASLLCAVPVGGGQGEEKE